MDTIMPTIGTKARQGLGLLLILLLVFGVASVGAVVTDPAIQTWYGGLQRPSFAPPNWIFSPVWILLYLMMSLAAWIVWKGRDWSLARGPLTLFFMQLILNGFWPVLFFGLKRPDLALIEILILWLAIGVTLLSFWRAQKLAGALLIPYWAWVSFAVILNFEFYRLNG